MLGTAIFSTSVAAYTPFPLQLDLGGHAICFLPTAVACLFFNVVFVKFFDNQDCRAVPNLQGLIASQLLVLLISYVTWNLLLLSLAVLGETLVLLNGLFIASSCLVSARVWAFINPKLSAVSYEDVSGDFYQDSTQRDEVGRFRAWYHIGRYSELENRIKSAYKGGDVIYDFGCGSAEWNRAGLPVVGIDVNRALLESGLSKGQLSRVVVKELEQTDLPASSADIVVMSEVMEHLPSPMSVLREIHRVLKPGGTVIITVPWDTPFSIFFWLFNLHSFYRGYILGEPYYRQRCGHINHFSGGSLRRLLRRAGFEVTFLYRLRGFLLYAICTK
jgi:SAM-dependent methyltransferase